jgi:hypothetical protein
MIHSATDGHSPSDTNMSSLVAEGQGPAADNAADTTAGADGSDDLIAASIGAEETARADGNDDPMAGQAASIRAEETARADGNDDTGQAASIRAEETARENGNDDSMVDLADGIASFDGTSASLY